MSARAGGREGSGGGDVRVESSPFRRRDGTPRLLPPPPPPLPSSSTPVKGATRDAESGRRGVEGDSDARDATPAAAVARGRSALQALRWAVLLLEADGDDAERGGVLSAGGASWAGPMPPRRRSGGGGEGSAAAARLPAAPRLRCDTARPVAAAGGSPLPLKWLSGGGACGLAGDGERCGGSFMTGRGAHTRRRGERRPAPPLLLLLSPSAAVALALLLLLP